MKTQIIIYTFIFLAISSCGNNRTAEQPNQEIPKALEDKNSSFGVVSKRGYGDLVENLYDELADKTPELKQLENKIDSLNSSKGDSTGVFDKYNGKNQSYYSSADKHIDQIKDSVLRNKLKFLISSSLTKYNSQISRHTNLLTSIDVETLTLNDLHSVLKIIRTLPLIENYQNDNLPTTKSLEGYLKQLSETVKYADTLTKK